MDGDALGDAPVDSDAVGEAVVVAEAGDADAVTNTADEGRAELLVEAELPLGIQLVDAVAETEPAADKDADTVLETAELVLDVDMKTDAAAELEATELAAAELAAAELDTVRLAECERVGGAEPVAVGVTSGSVHWSTDVAPAVPAIVEYPMGHAVHWTEPSTSA